MASEEELLVTREEYDSEARVYTGGKGQKETVFGETRWR